MAVAFYSTLNEADHIIDGHVARLHLEKRLAMTLKRPHDVPGLQTAFSLWLTKHQKNILIHPNGPLFLLPPNWF
jgi:hypothetical protein